MYTVLTKSNVQYGELSKQGICAMYNGICGKYMVFVLCTIVFVVRTWYLWYVHGICGTYMVFVVSTVGQKSISLECDCFEVVDRCLLY